MTTTTHGPPDRHQPLRQRTRSRQDAEGTPAPATEAADWKERWKAGGWYLGVPILSAGVLAAVPFWHARSRLGRPELRSWAIWYTGAGLALMAVAGITPRDAQGDPAGMAGRVLETINGVAALAVIIAACVVLSRVRREVFSRPGWRVLAPARPVVAQDPVRVAREQARALRAEDPDRAWELGIGRPDLGRDHDSGGLVDLNSAPAWVIADACGGDQALADRIVEARIRRGVLLYRSVDDVAQDVWLAPSVAAELRERAVF